MQSIYLLGKLVLLNGFESQCLLFNNILKGITNTKNVLLSLVFGFESK